MSILFICQHDSTLDCPKMNANFKVGAANFLIVWCAGICPPCASWIVAFTISCLRSRFFVPSFWSCWCSTSGFWFLCTNMLTNVLVIQLQWIFLVLMLLDCVLQIYKWQVQTDDCGVFQIAVVRDVVGVCQGATTHWEMLSIRRNYRCGWRCQSNCIVIFVFGKMVIISCHKYFLKQGASTWFLRGNQ